MFTLQDCPPLNILQTYYSHIVGSPINTAGAEV